MSSAPISSTGSTPKALFAWTIVERYEPTVVGFRSSDSSQRSAQSANAMFGRERHSASSTSVGPRGYPVADSELVIVVSDDIFWHHYSRISYSLLRPPTR